MPCNCSRRAIQQTMQKVDREDKIKKQKEEIERLRKEYELKKQNEIKKENELKKQNELRQINYSSSPPSIKSINITGGDLVINYKGGSGPTGSGASGLLASTAYNAANKTLNSDGDNVFRSVGYFGVGFGGNTEKDGKLVSDLSLDQMNLDLYTHINIAFFAVGENGDIIIPNSFSSQGSSVTSNLPQWLIKLNNNFPKGESKLTYDYTKALLGELDSQRKKINKKNVKLLPSIGGWNIANNGGDNTQNFGANLMLVAEDSINKSGIYSTFIQQVKELLNAGYIDGIDVDWEYPGRTAQESYCIKYNNTSYSCKVSDPTQIGPCDSTSDSDCTSFYYRKSPGFCKKTPSEYYRQPQSNTKSGSWDIKYVNYYTNFMTNLKEDMIATKSNSELTIAMAGAPDGLTFYATGVVGLLKDNGSGSVIDFANVMAYDYNGFWTGGNVSGFLSNYTNFDTLDVCTTPSTASCRPVGCVECGGQAPCKGVKKCATWNGTEYSCIQQPCTGCTVCPENVPNCKENKAKEWDSCASGTIMSFNKDSSNNLVPNANNGPSSCALTMYNELAETKKNQYLVSKMTSKGNWMTDNGAVKLGNGTNRITLSTKTILYILIDIYGIDPKKLVLGLPYYGRTFQTGNPPVAQNDQVVVPAPLSANKFTDQSYGLYQPYQYGSTYSFYDIYSKFYTNETGGPNVYNVTLSKGDTPYTEQIVYADSKEKMLSQITPDMNEEMITYNSIDAISKKVIYAKERQLGGYMCWHMLSDYYENVPTS